MSTVLEHAIEIMRPTICMASQALPYNEHFYWSDHTLSNQRTGRYEGAENYEGARHGNPDYPLPD